MPEFTNFIQDEITLHLTETHTETHETVRISVNLDAQVSPKEDEETFRTRVRTALRQFINADWRISGLTRQTSASSQLETVRLAASARIPEKENRKLDERIGMLSAPGFVFGSPFVEQSLPFGRYQEIQAELRLALLKRAKVEAESINAALETDYRVSEVNFSVDDPSGGKVRAANTMISNSAQAYGSTVNTYEAGADDDAPADLSVSTRFVLTATVVLRHLVDQID